MSKPGDKAIFVQLDAIFAKEVEDLKVLRYQINGGRIESNAALVRSLVREEMGRLRKKKP